MRTPDWLDLSDKALSASDKSSRLYKYTYGVKDLQIRYKEFSKASAFVTKPYVVDGNIIEVSLITDENNYSTNSFATGISPYDTTIEYYISFKEDPRYDEWIPILPQGTEAIYEYLITSNSSKGSLRFICNPNKEICVYRNGVKLAQDFWSYYADNSIVIDKGYDKNAIYSVLYYPDVLSKDPWNIELRPEDREIIAFTGIDGTDGEVFRNGTDRNGIINLNKYPYIDYSRINTGDTSYNPIEVSLENGKIAGPNKTVYSKITKNTVPATKNVTDYKMLTTPTLVPYDMTLNGSSMVYPYFEYVQDGRKICFTETFNNSSIVSNMPTNHGDAQIRVKYEYLRSKFRFKAILRNISTSTQSITPSVSNYSLVFKVMR